MICAFELCCRVMCVPVLRLLNRRSFICSLFFQKSFNIEKLTTATGNETVSEKFRVQGQFDTNRKVRNYLVFIECWYITKNYRNCSCKSNYKARLKRRTAFHVPNAGVRCLKFSKSSASLRDHSLFTAGGGLAKKRGGSWSIFGRKRGDI